MSVLSRARRAPPFPTVSGCSVRTLGIGAAYFERMLQAIRAASRSIDVEMYLWEDDDLGRSFADALAAAAARGLRVRVLVDAYGAREVSDDVLDAVRHAGGAVLEWNAFRLSFLPRLIRRTHKKLLIVDGAVAFTGGAGFSSHFTAVKRRERPWHDRMFEFGGPIVRQIMDAIDRDFARAARGVRGASAVRHAELEPSPADQAGTTHARVLRGWPDRRDFRDALLAAAGGAQRRLLIGTPYFLPQRRLRRALRRAVRRGVDVRIVVPGREGAHWLLWYASRSHYANLLRAGVRISEFGPEFYHAKLAVQDDALALVGSSNLDAWSWRRNAELDIALSDAESVEMVADAFLADEARSHPVTLREHGARGWMHRALESFAGAFDEWL